MSQGPESQGPPAEPPAEISKRTMKWRDAALHVGALKARDIITGFEGLEELDIFAANVGYWLVDKSPDLHPPKRKLITNGRKVIVGWYRQPNAPSEEMKPRHGRKLEDISVVMEEDERSSVELAVERVRKKFLIIGHVIGGKGIEVNVAKECTMGTYTRLGKETGLVTVSYKNIPSLGLAAMENKLRGTDAATKEDAVHILYVGIPGSRSKR
jgi:hypothetical protein